jgi:hypothetical protein
MKEEGSDECIHELSVAGLQELRVQGSGSRDQSLEFRV